MKKSLSAKTALGYLGIVLAVLLTVFSPRIYNVLIDFVINNLSTDHEINLLTKFKIGASLVSLISVIVLVSIFLITNLGQWIRNSLNKLISTEEVRNFFISDEICTRTSHNGYTIILGSLAGFFVYFYYLFTGIVQNEGKMEFYTTFLFPISIGTLVISLLSVRKMELMKNMSHQISIIIAGIAILIFLYLGEEISWGQQIFHWKSAEIFNDYNFQQETNVHNFLNPLFKYLYPIAGFLAFVTLFFFWVFPVKSLNYLFHLFLPHRSMLFLILLFACTTFLDYREVSEEVFSIICLFYSFRIFLCTKYPVKFIESVKPN